MDWIEKDKKYVWHPFTQAQTAPENIPIVRAEGAWLYAADDKRYLDGNSSWWTINHGHANRYIADKIHEQFLTADHLIFAGATHPKSVEVAERIVNVLGGTFQKVFFSDNGSTSVEVAIKMVYQYWYNKKVRKKRFLALEGAYHGDTFGAMSVGQRGYFNKPFEHLFFDVDYIPFPTDENYETVLQLAETYFKTGEFAGFIFEPLVQGAAGMRIYKAEWLDALVKLAKKYNVLTIADEVMTGFYRTGSFFAIHDLNHQPDFICLSKGVTGGVMPVGLTVTTQAVYEAFLGEEIGQALLHGHSFTGNPLSCAAICASLDLFEREETLASIEMISKRHKQFIDEYGDHACFKQIKSQGTILSIEISDGKNNGYFSDIRVKAYQHFLANEILIRPLGNIIFVNPPYCVTEEELTLIYSSIVDFANGL